MTTVVDTEAPSSGGGGKGTVACETMVELPPCLDERPADPDLPAESFRLPMADILDWVSRNAAAAAYYGRDGSTRGISNPKSRAAAHLPTTSKSDAGNQRRHPDLKVPIIGLSGKIRSPRNLGQKRRQHGANGRFFPEGCGDASEGSGRAPVPETEPTSPKVSCFGTVHSGLKQTPRPAASTARERVVSRESSSASSSASTWETAGLWASVLGFTCCPPRRQAAALLGERGTAVLSRASTSEVLPPPPPPAAEETVAAAPTPGLGGMRRVSSGRSAASSGSDLDLELEGRRSESSLTGGGEEERGGAASV